LSEPSESWRADDRSLESLGRQIEWEGKLFSAGSERFRHGDGTEVKREKVWHPGAVGILPMDDDHVWLTRQPREVVGATASLEIPAGKLDVAGESPLQSAQRELAEEIGRQAARWTELFAFYSSPGFSDERVWLFLAEDLTEAPETEADEDERIEIVRWPLDRVGDAIAECEDAKSLIALLWLRSAHRPRSASSLA
jgi:8-oxo-dGTP pyrophosphatase MutT (NUDIX family)